MNAQPSTTRGHHLLFFAPVAGLVVTFAAWLRHPTTDPEGKQDLGSAARWQALGAWIVVLHGGLQLGVMSVRWVWQSGRGLGPTLDHLMPLALKAITWLNVGSGVAEWLLLGAWAVAASRGKPYPGALLRRLGSRAPGGDAKG